MTLIPTIAMILASAVLVSAAEPRKMSENVEIEKMTREAKTATDHAALAGHWETRASALEAQAAKYEQDAGERSRSYNAMKHKWPAMAQGPIDLLLEKAAKARLAAQEARELMARHQKLAESVSAEE